MVLPDELVVKLPSLPRQHPQHRHWNGQGYALERLIGRLRLPPYRLSVLVVGCGNGWAAHYLSQLEKCSVTAIDSMEENIAQARRLFGQEDNSDFQQADIFRDPINPGAFDQVLLYGVAQWYPDVGHLLGQALEYLNPHGEIHVLGSPFWELSWLPAAKKEKWAEFDKVGMPEMREHYFFHSVEEMTALGAQLLYSPWSRRGGLKRKVHRTKDSPYPWWMLAKEE
jgi:SAM-dependent methyltransferase